MKFRFDKVEKDDLKIVEGNLYIRTHNQWFLFMKGVKGYTFDTEFGEGVFSVIDAEGFRHVFYTVNGIYMKTENVEAVVGKYVNAEYVWTADTLVKYSDEQSEKYSDIEKVLEKMNDEVRELKSANRFADRSSQSYGLPEVVEVEEEESFGDFPYRC